MFTGLIEAIGTVRSMGASGSGGRVLWLELGDLVVDARVGDSIAINGVCLTVIQIQGTRASFDVSDESVKRSTLGSLHSGDRVNVERALRMGDRLGGHLVQGHVDGTATLERIESQASFKTLTFAVPAALSILLVEKGSVAVDGISLTIAELTDKTFSVAVIPQTLAATTLKTARVGDRVNIEADMIVKTVRRYLEGLIPQGGSLTEQQLRSWGF